MPADLRELLERTAASPTTPVDPTRIVSRSRRRTRRRRGGAGLTGVAIVALLAGVAWPGSGPGGGPVIEDVAADRPEVPALDLPQGWVRVQVGGAVFGIPVELEIVEVDADDPLPCDNVGNRAYLVTESYPVATRDAAGNEHVCNALGSAAPQLLAAPLSTVPAAHLGGDASWDPRPIGELDGAWRRGEVAPPDGAAADDGGSGAAGGDVAGRTAWYRVPAVDLHLRFVTTERGDRGEYRLHEVAVPLGAASAEAPGGTAADEPAARDRGDGGPGRAPEVATMLTGTWMRPDGGPAETEDTFEVLSQPGSDHCGWESAVLLTTVWPLGTSIERVGGHGAVRRYVRDPDGAIDPVFARGLGTDIVLPDDATSTGYRTDDLELWLGADDGRDGVFVVGDDLTEWWPRGDPACY